MKWYESEIVINDQKYLLDHLSPFDFLIQIPQTDKHSELNFRLSIRFSSHCISEKQVEGPAVPFPDENGTQRFFSIERHLLSLELPNIISELVGKQCYRTRHRRNFFTIESIDQNGKERKYYIYFTAKKVKGGVLIHIESAYIPVAPQRAKKKIRGRVLLANIFRSLPIR